MVSLIFFLLAAAFNAVMDRMYNTYYDSIFYTSRTFSHDFWNPFESWRNKWKNGDPLSGERYPGSSTVFVWLTDGWHIAKALFLICLLVSILTYDPLFDSTLKELAVRAIAWFFGFEITFRALKSDPNHEKFKY